MVAKKKLDALREWLANSDKAGLIRGAPFTPQSIEAVGASCP